MGRSREGTHIYRPDAKGKEVLYARVQWTDENGKRRQKEKRAVNISHANRLKKEMLRELDDHGPQSLDAERMTFAELADYFEEHHLIPAKYVDGRKINGLRSLASATSRFKVIKDYFGKKRLRSITYGDIEKYRNDRLDVPVVVGKSTRNPQKVGKPKTRQRSITSVNRELEVLRKMLNVAYREGWIHRNPFTLGEPLINKAFERKRERILTLEEEKALLEAISKIVVLNLYHGTTRRINRRTMVFD